MSTYSPAKQERIERHLMRQRGAGIRTVSATFGFSFGIGAPSSSKTTSPTFPEPPAKRRKTDLDPVSTVPEPTSDAARYAAHTIDTKDEKPRRRLDLDNEDGIRSHAPARDGDDSFVAGLESKRCLPKERKKKVAAEKRELVQPVAVPEAQEKGRPRRKAAVAAAGKVADEFAEEATSIDKKRRDVEVEKRPETNTADVKDGRPSKERIKAVPRRGREKKEDKDVEKEPTTPDAQHFEPEHTEETAKASRSKAGTSGKRKKQTASTDVPAKKVPKRGPRPKRFVAQNEDPRPAEEQEALMHVSPEKTATSDQHRSVSPAKRPREPLRDTDTNVMVQSVSPEKPAIGSARAEVDRDVVKSSKTSSKTKAADKPAKRRRKVDVQRDDEPPQLAHPKVIEEASRDGAASQQPIGAPELERTTAEPVTSGKAHKSTQPARDIPAKEDEDIDWLFEAPRAKTAPKRAAPSARRNHHPRRKDVNIDLDDLLEDIASFAAKTGLDDGNKGMPGDGVSLWKGKSKKRKGKEI